MTNDNDDSIITRAQKVKITIHDGFVENRMVIVITSLVLIWLVISYGVYIVEAGDPKANIHTFGDGLWWGIVTFLTVGYGDHFPVTFHGRILGGLLAVSGVLAIGIVTAKISSIFLEQALLKGRGIVDKDNLLNHFIICGWKDDMHDLILHILDCNPDLSSADIVLVAKIDDNMIDTIKSHTRLSKLKIIVGESYQETNLRRAAPERARKVLILADRTPSRDGHIPSATEADARTIMAAITLSNIARTALVTAEILDPKLDHYLKMAGVAEIIYSREYSRLMLGNASSGTGVSNVIYDLIDPHSAANIGTEAVPNEFLSKTYGEFKAVFEKSNPNRIVIGIMEHTGNPHRIRDMALREAQKTPNVEKLITNLQAVKKLRCNNPVFHPEGSFVLAPGSGIIFIQSSRTDSGNPSLSTRKVSA